MKIRLRYKPWPCDADETVKLVPKIKLDVEIHEIDWDFIKFQMVNEERTQEDLNFFVRKIISKASEWLDEGECVDFIHQVENFVKKNFKGKKDG